MKPTIQFHSITGLKVSDIKHYPIDPSNPTRPEFWSRDLTLISGKEEYMVPLFSYVGAEALVFPASATAIKEPFVVAAKLVDTKAEADRTNESAFYCPACKQALSDRECPGRPGTLICINQNCEELYVLKSEAIPF